MKQWELENNSKVKLPDGTIATFIKMDGKYARWNKNGRIKIGNFEDFEKTKFGYRVKEQNEHTK